MAEAGREGLTQRRPAGEATAQTREARTQAGSGPMSTAGLETQRLELLERAAPAGLLTVTYCETIQGSVEKVMEAWFEVVWDQGGMQSMPLLGSHLPPPRLVHRGDGNRVGCFRQIPNARFTPAVSEQILDVDPGRQVQYACVKMFPASYHRGVVTFEDQGDGSTLVSWTARCKPFPLLRWLVRLLVWFGFTTSLRSLKESQQPRDAPRRM